MPEDQASTLEFVIEELRRIRVRAGLTQEEMAKRLSYSASLIGMIETGQRPLRRDFVRRVDQLMKTDGHLERLLLLARRQAAPSWFRPWAVYEEEAVELRTFQTIVVPGLLQTAAYARAVLSAGLYLDEELERRLAARLDRQAILTRDEPPVLWVVLDEGVLRRPVGGPAVMAEQLAHLITMVERPRIFVHVVPNSAGLYPGLAGPFVLATLSSGEEVAYLDTLLAGQVVQNPEELAIVKRTWEALRTEALTQSQSLNLIREVAKEWTV